VQVDSFDLRYNYYAIICKQLLGSEHPDVAKSLNGLAWLYYTQGQYETAKPLYQRALAIYEKALGSEHLKLATFLENYALLLRKMDRPEEAGQLEARVRSIRAKSVFC
jgi:tetratricopeptide (TPR) repeat protein